MQVGIGCPISLLERSRKRKPVVHLHRFQIALTSLALVGMLFVPPQLGAIDSGGCGCQRNAAQEGCCQSCPCGEDCACHLQQHNAPSESPAQAPSRDEIRPVNVAIALPVKVVAGGVRNSVVLATLDSPWQVFSALVQCALLSRFLL